MFVLYKKNIYNGKIEKDSFQSQKNPAKINLKQQCQFQPWRGVHQSYNCWHSVPKPGTSTLNWKLDVFAHQIEEKKSCQAPN